MTDISNGHARAGYQFPVILLCAVFFLLPAIFNQAPFVYFDSASYLSQAGKAVQMLQGRLDGVSVGTTDAVSAATLPPKSQTAFNDINYAGRSIYYSFLAWTGAATLGASSIVVLQALVFATLIVTTLRAVWPNAPPTPFLTAAVVLSGSLALLSSAGFFVSLIMPDIWAGMMILAFALLISGNSGIGVNSRLALGAVMTLAALFHSSHLALLAAMVGLLVLAMLHPGCRRIIGPRSYVLPALALVCALAGHAGYSVVATAVTGQAPVTRPFVTAHLVEMGPGTRLVQGTCPDSGFAICPYAERLPTKWIDFLFSHDPQTGVFAAAQPSVQRALSEEQASFALATLAAEPLATTIGLIHDGVAQLWQLSVDDVPLSSGNQTFVERNFTQAAVATIKGSMIWDRPWVAPALTRLIQVGTALSALALLGLALTGGLRGHGPLTTLLLVCLIGLVLNALICGMLASPYGRFQARVSWLVPLFLILTVLTVRFPAFAASRKNCP